MPTQDSWPGTGSRMPAYNQTILLHSACADRVGWGLGGGKATPADGSPKAGAQMPVPAGCTWSVVAIHLLVRHRHDRMLELFPEVRDGLVDQEDGHGHEQQVDEDE